MIDEVRGDDKGGRPGKYSAIKCKVVEIEHHGRIGSRCTNWNEPFREENRKVAIDGRIVRHFRMDYKKAHHAHSHLCHFIKMRMVHKCTVLFQLVFIFESLARFYGNLKQARYSVHPIG